MNVPPNTTNQHSPVQSRRAWPALLATAPLLWLVWFFGYALRARLALGRWPRPGQPDPYELGFHLHHISVTLGLPLSLACALTVLVTAPFLERMYGRALKRALLALLAIVSTGISLGVARSDPHNLFVWFID